MLVTYVMYHEGAIIGVQSKFLDAGADLLREARSYKAAFPSELSDIVITVFDNDRLAFDYFDTV